MHVCNVNIAGNFDKHQILETKLNSIVCQLCNYFFKENGYKEVYENLLPLKCTQIVFCCSSYTHTTPRFV
jgi:hypothetical protein